MEPTSKKTSRKPLSLFLVVPRPQQSWFDTHYFDPIPGDYFRCQLRLLQTEIRSRCYWIEFTELTGKLITRKTIFVCCSQKVRGRTTAPLKKSNKRPNNEQPNELKTNESPTEKKTAESVGNISAMKRNQNIYNDVPAISSSVVSRKSLRLST